MLLNQQHVPDVGVKVCLQLNLLVLAQQQIFHLVWLAPEDYQNILVVRRANAPVNPPPYVDLALEDHICDLRRKLNRVLLRRELRLQPLLEGRVRLNIIYRFVKGLALTTIVL